MRNEIVSCGGVPPLISLLLEGDDTGKQHSAAALARLSHNDPDTTMTIGQLGAIGALVELLSGAHGESAQEEGAGALLELAELAENRIAITELGGIGPLVALLGSSNGTARERAEGALVRLSIESANRVLIIKQLVDMLRGGGEGGEGGGPDKTVNEQEQEQAAAALANLAKDSADNRVSIVDAGGIEPLLALLMSSKGVSTSSMARESSVRELAASFTARGPGALYRRACLHAPLLTPRGARLAGARDRAADV